MRKIVKTGMKSFESFLVDVGLAVKDERVKAGLTQEQLISKIHSENQLSGLRKLAIETLSRIENGRINPSLKQVYIICSALSIEPSELFFRAKLNG